MKKVLLIDVVTQFGQSAVAKGLGVSAPAITKALKAKREIFVNCHEDGSFTAEELRPFPSQQQQKKNAA